VVPIEHGTHVAGIIAGRKAALTGGLASKVNLVLVPGDSFADLKNVIKRAREQGVFIYNISQTFPPGNDIELNTLAKRLGEWQDSLFVVAAGNKEGTSDPNINAGEPPAPVRWAAKLRNVMGVAAADRSGNDVLGDHRDPDDHTLNPGSNFGSLYVDLLAPGELVCSLGRTDYAYGCGSSQAAPQVSAAAAMLWTRLRSPERLRARLLYTADWRSLYLAKAWGGMLNVRRALSFTDTNVLTLSSENDQPHEVIINGTPMMRIDGEEYLRDGTHPAAGVTVAFNKILRMVPESGGEHRVFYQDNSGHIHIVQGRVTGKIACKSLTHFDSVNGHFGATPHPRAICQPGIDAGQIADYVASTPGSVQFP
jgi:subtilisin family serine protease